MHDDLTHTELSLGSALFIKLEWYIHEEYGPTYDIKAPPYGDPTYRELHVKSLDSKLKTTYVLHVFPKLYPSQLPQILNRFRKHQSEKDKIHILGTPKLSKVSRDYLIDQEFPFIDLAGGLYITLKLDERREKILEINRDETYEGKQWARREPSVLPGISAGRVAIYRTLHTNKDESWTVRGLARAAGMDAGTTSRYLKELLNAGWVERRSRTEQILVDPSALLDHWTLITRKLRKHFVRRCQLRATDYAEMRELVEDYVSNHQDTYHTLWSGAEFHGHFQEEPIVALYCADTHKTMRELGARPAISGRSANLWLLRRTDKVLGQGAIESGEERAVCWQQIYVDLMNAPHRGKSIAAMLREEMEEKIGV